MQSPDKRAYICRSCSEIAQQLITSHQSPGMGRLALALLGTLLLGGILFGVLYAITNALGS